MKIRIHPLPNAADIAFAIRDDDVSYFTPPEKLEMVYNDTWGKEYKVSFATVPMHKGTNNLNVPREFRNDGKYHPINQNEELVKYLKAKISEGKVDIMQHGFCHTEDSNLPGLKFDLEKGQLSNINGQKIDLVKYSEFYRANGIEVHHKIEKGKIILEDTFGVPIKVFVSPQEFLTRPLWKALWKNNLNYCGGVGSNIITQVPIGHMNFYPLLKVAVKKASKHNLESIGEDMAHFTDIITVPATYRHYWNKFINDKLATHWFNHFKTIFESKKKQNGHFILLTHYWEYFYDWGDEITQRRQHEYLNKILKYVDDNSNVWKCTISELMEWIMVRDSIKIKETHGEVKIFSPYDINGLSIKIQDRNMENISDKNAEIKEINGKCFMVLDMKAGQKITKVVL
jgi:predicted deacetylase